MKNNRARRSRRLGSSLNKLLTLFLMVLAFSVGWFLANQKQNLWESMAKAIGNKVPQIRTKRVVPEPTYELCLGTVQDLAQADSLKAKLALIGMAVNILPIYQDKIRRFAVNLGPYADLRTAVAVQNRLKTEGMHSVVRYFPVK